MIVVFCKKEEAHVAGVSCNGVQMEESKHRKHRAAGSGLTQ